MKVVCVILVSCFLSLEHRSMAASVSWVGGSGDWNTPTNWSAGALPGPNDDVVIDQPGVITVTHSSGTRSVKSLLCQETFVLSGGSLTVSNTVQANNGFNLSGGTLLRATVLPGTNGQGVTVTSGTLDGVTMNGVLDVGNSVSGSSVTVTNGLVLNGTTLVGNSTNQWYGHFNFAGSQTLGGNGTVVFGIYTVGCASGPYYNSLRLLNGGTTLTLGSGITVRGQNGTIGYQACFGGPQNISIINQGTISADVSGGTIIIIAQPFSNQGVVQSPAGTLNLAGTIATGNVGSFLSGNGVLALSGILSNTSQTLVLSGTTNVLRLRGGKILGGSVVTSNGASLVVNSGTLDGVTMNGVLDVGNTSSNGVSLTVTNGLVLNGTALVGNPTNGVVNSLKWWGEISFAGSQTLSGNGAVVFGNAAYIPASTFYFINALRLRDAGTTLTIGPGITVRGQNGTIGNLYWGGPTNVTIINQGTISADVAGGTIVLFAHPFSNLGLVRSPAGTVILASTMQGLGTVDATGGTVQLAGLLDNTGFNLVLDTSANALQLAGGTIRGGTITAANGGSLVVDSGTLDGVTVNGVLDVGVESSAQQLIVTNGLVLNGIAHVGNPTNANRYGAIGFAGSQTLGGNGTVVFGNHVVNFSGQNHYYNSLRLMQSNTTLTLGPGITVRGQNGTVGYNSGWGGSTNLFIINESTISADVAAGVLSLEGLYCTNGGTLRAASGGSLLAKSQNSVSDGHVEVLTGGSVDFNGTLYFDDQQALVIQQAGVLRVSGSILGDTRNVAEYVPNGSLMFDGSGTPGNPQFLEVMSQDVGSGQTAFIDNFAYGMFTLMSNTYVQLVDQEDNSPDSNPEALYVNSLILPIGTTLNLNGLHLYARAAQIAGTIAGGSLTLIPDSGPISLATATPGAISVAGELDEWTFFGRAGQSVTIAVDTGSGNVVSPQISYAEVRLLGPSGSLLARGSNAIARQTLTLTDVALPADGSYHIQVLAPANRSASTGYYAVTLWEVAPDVASLVLNQQVNGRIETPYSVDRWTFSAVAGQQVRFDLVNASAPGVAFDLRGPNGGIGFTNLVGDSGLVTLPDSGGYTLTAHGIGGSYNIAYAFRLVETVQTELTLGTTFAGNFAGNGQAQIFRVNVPTSSPMRVFLDDTAIGNHNEVYVRFGSPPTRADFDYRFTGTGADQQVLIPNAPAGTWYVLVYGESITTPSGYTLQVTTSGMIVSGVTPDHHGNARTLTMTLAGAGFDPTTIVELVASGGASFAADAVSVDSFTQLTATFASNTVPAGRYSVLLSQPDGDTSLLTNAFEMTSGGVPRLETRLVAPGSVGRHTTATFYVEYANRGDVAMAAPLLVLRASNRSFLTTRQDLLVAGFWTSAIPRGFGDTIQIFGCGRRPGVLLPGETIRVPIYYAGQQLPWYGDRVQFALGIFETENNSAVDWLSLKTSMRPQSITVEAWDPIWSNFTNHVGATWGDYVSALNDNAAYLGRLGIRIADVSQLLAFKITQADGLSVIRSIASFTDASTPTPGLRLSFERIFPQSISRRYDLGVLGRGWSHNWDMTRSVAADGTVTVTGPAGTRRTFQPDSRGGYFAQTGDHGVLEALAGNIFKLTESRGLVRQFRADGKLDYVQDPNANRITCGYSGNQLVSLSHFSGQSLQLTYNGAGRIATITDPAGRQTILSYDGSDQHLVTAHYFDGSEIHYTYQIGLGATREHALTEIAYHGGNHRYFSYDAQGHLSGFSRDGGAEAVTFAYDSAGTVSATDADARTTRFFLDHRGLLAKMESPLGQMVTLKYDEHLNLTGVTDPAGHSQTYAFDSAGNLIQSADANGGVTRFSYAPPFNRLLTLADAKSHTTGYGNDAQGNLRNISYANGSIEKWNYDTAGNPITWTNRRGQIIGYQFNANGQLATKSYPDGRSISYNYNSHRLPTNIADSAQGVTRLRYDARDFLTNITYPDGKGFTFAYDAAGRRTGRAGHDGYTLIYTYDSVGRLASLSNAANKLLVQYAYDPAGRLTRESKGNGTFTTYAYDLAGQIVAMTNAAPNGTLQSFFNYIYDVRGNRISMTTATGVTAYAYDDLNQLTEVNYPGGRHVIYAYDALGNRTVVNDNGTNTTYAANSVNEYMQAGPATFAYDADGNLTSRTDAAGTTSYQFDADNRLVSATTPTNGVWQYIYDALGNRTAVIHDGAADHFLIDPFGLTDVAAEYDSGGVLIARYDHALGLVSREDTSGTAAFFSFDALGNTRQLIGNDGTVLNSYAYDVFGAATLANESVSNPFRFVGRFGVTAELTGLHYMRARHYDASVGRFTSADPVNLAGGDFNMYRYANNSPEVFSDPQGLEFSVSFKDKLETLGNLTLPFSRAGRRALLETASTASRAAGSLWDALNYLTGLEETALEQGYPATFVPEQLHNGTHYFFHGPRYDLFTDLSTLTTPPVPPTTAADATQTQTAGSGDPNGKIGPSGYGLEKFFAQDNTLSYRVDFANDPSVTAPAQFVRITDRLDANLNESTFEIREIGFGDQMIAVPEETQHFQTKVPLNSNGVSFEVQIEVGIRLATREVFAVFSSIVPETGLPPDVLTGFLPPENGTGRGMGHIAYTIRPKTGLTTGIQTRNVALITFDQNPSIATNQRDPHNPAAGTDPEREAFNTIDAGAPSSSVSSLPSESGHAFLVQWSGQDDAGGSGVGSYDVFVSTNGGPFTRWLDGVNVTSAPFIGELGQSYAFYSTAHDRVGHLEAPPVIADAQTMVIANAPLLTVVTNQFVGVGASLTISNMVQGPPVGSFIYSLGSRAPAGTSINPTNGLFRWTPTCSQGSTTNSVTIWVTDSGRTNISDALIFTVVVRECVAPQLGRLVLRAGDTGRLPINLISSVPLSNLVTFVRASDERFENLGIEPLAPEICTNSIETVSNSLYLVTLTTCSNSLVGTQQVAWLLLTAASNQHSAFVPVEIGPSIGTQPDGTIITNYVTQSGMVVVVGEEPLLEALRSTNGMVQVILYALPGTTNSLQQSNELPLQGVWMPWQQIIPTNLLHAPPPLSPTNRAMFLRAVRP
jgi:RHS repeat-associated protein